MNVLFPRPLEVEVWNTLSRLHNVVSRQLQQHLERFNLTSSQYHVLRHLGEQGVLKSGNLATLLDVTPGNLTGILDRLEAAGLIQRERDPQDRRGWQLSLTPEGQKLYRKAVPSTRTQVQEMFAGLAPQEIATLHDLASRLLSSLRELEVSA